MNLLAPWWMSGACDSGLGKSLQGNFRPTPYHGGRIGGADGRIIAAPFWMVVASGGTLAILPWAPWSKRFSLLTLLIATTLVAAILGVIVILTR
jgi:hypothetical protein